MFSLSSPSVVLCFLSISLVAGNPRHRSSRSSSTSTLHSSRASALQEVEAIQATLNFMICQIGQQSFAAAQALGITSQSVNCIVPGSISDMAKSTINTPVKIASTLPASVVPAVPQVAVVQAKVVPVVSSNTIAGVAIGQIQAAAPVVPASTRQASPSLTAASTPTLTVEVPVISIAAPVVDPNICTSSNPQDCINQAEALEAHNSIRATHHAPPLTWNATLAEGALRWANNCQWKHSEGTVFPFIYGENLYSSTLPAPATTMTQGIQAFNNEEAEYNYDSPGYDEATGHFTQVVWKSTAQVGCAIINCDLPIFHQYTNTSAILVCEYYPSGNWLGEFGANVLKP